jgi:chromosome segregation ATPase
MDAVGNQSFRCSDRALVRWFRKSRNTWKGKAVVLRKTIKGLKRCVADVQDSRANWKQRAQAAESALSQSQQEVARLQAEREHLEQTLTAEREKKARARRTNS